MPAHDVIGESGVEHVTMYIAALFRDSVQDFLPQERGDHPQLLFRQVPHPAERECQVLVRPYGCDLCEEAEPAVSAESLFWHYEILVQKQVLVAYAYLGDRYPEQHVREPREQFIEIHHNVRPA